MFRLVAAALSALLVAPLAGAQSTASTPPADSGASSVAGNGIPRPANDSLFRRARRMVSEGNGVAGRALVDSLLASTDPGTPAYGDALYWHGALAPTAAAAETDYRRVIVEYPLAYYSGDALLAIAELEQARGDRVGAMQHLQRFVREHPDNPGRGLAALGVARLAFEQRDSTLACSMLAEARRSVSASDVELRNQIEYYGNRCAPGASAPVAGAPVQSGPAAPVRPSVAATTPSPERKPVPATATTGATKAGSKEVSTAVTSAAAGAPARSATLTAATGKPAVREPTSSKAARSEAASRGTAKAPVHKDAKGAKKATHASPASVKHRTAQPTQPTSPARTASAARASRRVTGYTVQVAAYDTRADADALVKKLAARGVKARVSGASKPFRVRLAVYSSRTDAINELTTLQKRGIDGFVAEEDRSPGARKP